MQVSFIIPLYNCLGLTKAMLASLQDTLPTGLSYEIIFVDDGSTDGTREWLSGLSSPCHSLLNEKNLGFAGTCNRGAASARGEVLFFLNNDLVLLPGWFEPMLAGLNRLPKAGIMGNVQLRHADRELDHAGIIIAADGKPAHLKTMPASPAGAVGYATMPAVTGACFAISRDLFQHFKGFDEQFQNGGEDVDLCFRARAAGYTTWVALQSTVLHHISASPGRNTRNEQNSYLLHRRWRTVLEREAWRTWCEALLTDINTQTIPRHHQAEKAARLFLRQRRTRPGRWAESNVRQNMRIEEARWIQMFPEVRNALAAHPDCPLS